MRVFEFRRRAHGQRRADRADVGLELLLQPRRDVRGDELREDLLVRELLRDDVFQPVEADELVEVLRGDHHRAGNHDAHPLVHVVLAVLDEHGVHEGQPAGLAAERALADACEGYGVAVCRRVEARHDALAQQTAVVADEVHQHAAVFGDRGEMALVVPADGGRQGKEAPRVEPLRKVVLRGVVFERPVGDRGDHLLHLREVPGAADLGARLGVLEYEVAEGELAVDEVVQLREERLGVLGDEPRPECRGLLAEGRLGGLQQHGHQRVVLADAAAEVDAGVELLALGRIVAVQDEPHVGDDAQQVLLVAFVQLRGLLVAAGQQDLGPGALAEDLLLRVEGVLDELGVLQQDEFVELGQVGRVEADRVLDEQDGLHASFADVLGGVHLVLDELDDGDDELRVAVPAEDVVQSRAVLLLYPAVDVLRKGGQQRHGDIPMALLDDAGEGEDVGLAHVVHGEDEVERIVAGERLERFGRRADACERGGIREVQVDILLVDLRFDVPVLLEDVAVVAAAHEQDFVNPVFHEPVGEPAAVGHVPFDRFVHRFDNSLIREQK